MKIYDLQLGELGANCYIVETAPGRCIAIDIGGDSSYFLSFLKEKELALSKILLTHGHFDHIGGVEEVRKATGAEVFVHDGDVRMLTSAAYSLHIGMSRLPFVPVERFTAINDGCVITDGDCTITLIHTPGHSEGSVCYVCGDVIFTGDTLFKGSAGRTDFPGSSPIDMHNSLYALYIIDKNCRIFPGHGETTTLEYEKMTNPFMRGFNKI